MTQQPGTDERLAILEKKVAELELQRSIQETRDHALLARIDTFIDDIHRVERVQMRGFEQMMTGQKEQATRLDSLEAGQHNLEQTLGVVVDTLKNHKTSIETVAGRVDTVVGQVGELASHMTQLAAGQQQILALLTGGKPPRND